MKKLRHPAARCRHEDADRTFSQIAVGSFRDERGGQALRTIVGISASGRDILITQMGGVLEAQVGGQTVFYSSRALPGMHREELLRVTGFVRDQGVAWPPHELVGVMP